MLALTIAGTQSFSQSLTPLVIGTIHPNDSVVIYYDVTINSGAGSQVTNQGTVTGSNFSNLGTDDPDTGTPNDPTITFLNMLPLPVRLLELSAIPMQGSIVVSWNVSNEINMTSYEVEKSNNGRSFTKIGEVASRNSLQAHNYSFVDTAPVNGVNYYRLRLIDLNAAAKYTIIVRVDLDGKNNGIRIYPNPATGQTITLQLSNMQKGDYELLFYNSLGQFAYRKVIHHDGGSASKNISLPGQLLRGIYSVQLKSDKIVFSQSLIVQ